MDALLTGATTSERTVAETNSRLLESRQKAGTPLGRGGRRPRRPSQTSGVETWTESAPSETTSQAYSVPSPGSDFQLTPPPHTSGRVDSDYPPTPPTLSDSDLLTPPPPDLVPETALTETLNGLYIPKSTPVMLEARSPPTPDPSPPGARRATLPIRPNLSKSPSSWTESYQTAKEELSTLDATSEIPSRPGSRAMTGARAFPTLYPGPENSPRIGLRGSAGHLDRLSSISNTHVRTQMRHLELESGVARALKHMAESSRMSAGRASASPRPQSANPYYPVGRRRLDIPRLSATPEPVSLAGFTRHIGADEPPTHLRKMATVTEVSAPEVDPIKIPETYPLAGHKTQAHQAAVSNDAPLSPTAAAFLQDNNNVYKIIQQENVRRHSSASDAAIQIFAKPAPAVPRTLRHSTKRHSLRAQGDISSESANGYKLASQPTKPAHVREEYTQTRPQTSSSLPPQTAMRGFERFKAQNPDLLASRPHSARPHPPGISNISNVPRASSTQNEGMRPTSRHVSHAPEAGHIQALRSVSGPSRLTQSSQSHRPGLNIQSGIQPTTPQLRKFSNEQRLENNSKLRQTAADLPQPQIRQPTTIQTPEPAPERRRWSETRSPHRESLDRSMLSPVSRSSDTRMLYSSTPNSMGQASDRTEIELCEARGLQMFPHSNNSLLLVQQTVRTVRQAPPFAPPPLDIDHLTTPVTSQIPTVNMPDQAFTREGAFSPLHNPRTAPEPPIINYIPPTPLSEVERPLEAREHPNLQTTTTPTRKLSIKQKVRRYSESLIHPLQLNRNNTLKSRRSKRASVHEERPTYLSSMWTPRGFWEDYYSDDDDDDDYDYENEHEPLPPGGDTSDVQDTPKRSILPRKLSVRMPGFRGTGGFLIGNSLGISRHGTNVRRHHVARRTSQEPLKRAPRRNAFRLPFHPAAQLRKTGQNAWKGLTTSRADREQEKRRDDLRAKIGATIYHDP